MTTVLVIRTLPVVLKSASKEKVPGKPHSLLLEQLIGLTLNSLDLKSKPKPENDDGMLPRSYHSSPIRDATLTWNF